MPAPAYVGRGQLALAPACDQPQGDRMTTDNQPAIKTVVNLSAPEFPAGEGGTQPDRNGTLGVDNMEVMVSASIPGRVMVQAWDTDVDPWDETGYAVVIEFTPQQARDLAAGLMRASESA